MAEQAHYALPVFDPFWSHLAEILLQLAYNNRLAIAYSGGLDSRFLAHAAQLTGVQPTLLHATGPHIPPAETDWAREWAALRGLELIEVPINPLERHGVAAGSENRCYDCKTGLFTAFSPILHELNLREAATLMMQDFSSSRGITLCDGSNISDNNAFRPGMRAVREFGVHSPLAAAGLDKERLRQLARETGMERPEQHPRPCLLTRLDYGLRPNETLLEQLANAEARIEALLCRPEKPGAPACDVDAIPDFRLRLFLNDRLELHISKALSPALQADIAACVCTLGLPEPVVLNLPSVSGYYDKLRGVQ